MGRTDYGEPGLVLSTFYADCVPLYVVDPVHRAIGMSHSGWRGTAARMGAVTLSAMQEAYGTRPEDVVCAVGPSICKDCYEVSADVADIFAEEFPGHEQEILAESEKNSVGMAHADKNTSWISGRRTRSFFRRRACEKSIWQ